MAGLSMSAVAQALRIARAVVKLAPGALDIFEELAEALSSKPAAEQERLAGVIATEIRRRSKEADDAIEFIRTGKT
ncbi:MAG TPA: hypothetical protein VFQ61_06340 [Polyangiaceae bacterium]|nr:hypothetical protein [Polyangiaceae bacterium]